ncbi:MAG: hypothetical protein FD129_479 [bacterium]|nr:MAG: hypothetical protein FD129_479 [bacterium]
MEIIIIPIVVGLFMAMVMSVNQLLAGVSKRRFLHRERMAALERGVPLPDELLVETEAANLRPGNHNTALGGIIWTGFGLGIMVSRNMVNTATLGEDFGQFMAFLSIWAYPTMFIGIGLLVYAWIIRDRSPRG